MSDDIYVTRSAAEELARAQRSAARTAAEAEKKMQNGN